MSDPLAPVRVADTRVETIHVMTPNDANFLGKVFGGHILSLIDLVAYAVSSKFAGVLCVTASFDRVDFHSPIEVGNLVKMVGHVSYVGRTSLEVSVDISAEDVIAKTVQQTNTARVTMVALRDGKPTPVPRLICETRDEHIQFLEGQLRREFRGRAQGDLQRMMERLRSLPDSELHSMVRTELESHRPRSST